MKALISLDEENDIIYKVARINWKGNVYIYVRNFLCTKEAKAFVRNKCREYDYEIRRVVDGCIMYRINHIDRRFD
jgi:hypothetical protein